jgi:hypothetical protein
VSRRARSGATSSGPGGQLVGAELAVAVGVEVGEQTVDPGLVGGGALGVRDRAVAVGVEALVAIAMTAAAILGGGHALAAVVVVVAGSASSAHRARRGDRRR